VSDAWFDYDGQTTDELLALEGSYRTDSLVAAFEQAIQQKPADLPLSKEERHVLAIEALEREVNNGGYGQFFLNSSHEFVDVIVEALEAVRCPKVAALTRRAIEALGIEGTVTGEKAEAVVLRDDAAVSKALAACDDGYYADAEPIADLLFAWIKENRTAVRVGAGG
jgi:hypothetical protein